MKDGQFLNVAKLFSGALACAALATPSLAAAEPKFSITINPSKVLLNDFDLAVLTKVNEHVSVGAVAEVQKPAHFSLLNDIFGVKDLQAREAEKFGLLARYHFNSALQTGGFISLKITHDQVRFEGFERNYDNAAPNPFTTCNESYSGTSGEGLVGYSWHYPSKFSSEIALGYRVSSLSGKKFACDTTEVEDQWNNRSLGIPHNGFIADFRIGMTF